MDFPENSPRTRVVGRYSASDPEREGVTWSDLSGADAGKFELNNTGLLTFMNSPNDEEQPEYEVTVNASDGGFTGSLDVTVTVSDVNEPPVVTRRTNTGAFSVVEHSGTLIGAFNATDPEGDAVRWSLTGTDAADFAISNGPGTPGELSFRGASGLRQCDRLQQRQRVPRHRAGHGGGRHRPADSRADGQPARDRQGH